MCSGRWAVALLAASVGTLSAQDVPRLQARADSLLREWRRASAVADMVDSLNHARAAGGTDTISVGALRIVTNPSPARLREAAARRSEEHTSELQSPCNLVCRLLLEKKKKC